jgi:threonine/homoserine/homoserine lactone efflux protein
MTNPLLFALAVLSILGVPGPTNTLLATAGAMGGVRRSLPLIPAEASSYLTTILTLGLLLKPIVLDVPHFAAMLQAAVAIYLLMLAFQLWRSSARILLVRRAPITPTQVFVTTLLNPKGIVFALVVIPFSAPRVWPYLFSFVLLCVAASLSWILSERYCGEWRAGADGPKWCREWGLLLSSPSRSCSSRGPFSSEAAPRSRKRGNP